MIFAKNFARNYEKKNYTWTIRRLVDENQPSDPAYYIEDCRIYGKYSVFCSTNLSTYHQLIIQS